MSYNSNPEWTKHIDDSQLRENAVCPSCNQTSSLYDTAVENIFEHGYYAPQRIPPTIILVCDNEECMGCDKDFVVQLQVTLSKKV